MNHVKIHKREMSPIGEPAAKDTRKGKIVGWGEEEGSRKERYVQVIIMVHFHFHHNLTYDICVIMFWRGVDAVMSGPSTKEHSIDITITQGALEYSYAKYTWYAFTYYTFHKLIWHYNHITIPQGEYSFSYGYLSQTLFAKSYLKC